jgi:hypothetical protein
MKINVLRPRTLFPAVDCNVTLNETKYVLNKNLSIEIQDESCDFYVNMFYVRTKKYTLKGGNSFTIEVDRLLNRKGVIGLCILTALVFVFDYFYPNLLRFDIVNIYFYLVVSFFIIINTIASRYYFTVKIKAE